MTGNVRELPTFVIKVDEFAGSVHYFAKFKQRVYTLLAQATRDGQPVAVRQAALMAWQRSSYA